MITTTTLDRDDGLKGLTNAVEAIRTTIKKYKGDFNEKAAVSSQQPTIFYSPLFCPNFNILGKFR